MMIPRHNSQDSPWEQTCIRHGVPRVLDALSSIAQISIGISEIVKLTPPLALIVPNF